MGVANEFVFRRRILPFDPSFPIVHMDSGLCLIETKVSGLYGFHGGVAFAKKGTEVYIIETTFVERLIVHGVREVLWNIIFMDSETFSRTTDRWVLSL